MASKSDLQWLFLQCLAKLIQHNHLLGHKFTMGRGYASEKANAADGGHKNSAHLHRLAIDLNLFVDGEFITGDHPVWHELGAFWLTLHPMARWGGDFSFKDYNHFSFENEGVK